ncbi:transposase [Rhizobium calliandrae]|uniref:Transposase n=1 Tax=Rhizobium calliandrae TaxID=1312182 RepID=A0ABT7KKV6_9HYPH|nr:transposase [Rhizobium calliandrae]MDL2409272.1 transposase [Rhizobium calliandrae]
MTLTGVGSSGSLRVTKVLRNGKRRFDPVEKERLIDAALEPGISIAGLALAYGINANQLRNWVKLRRERSAERKLSGMANSAPLAFVPVVAASPTGRPPAPSAPTSPRMRLKASLPNGVRLELEDADAQVLSAMIEALGRCDVPAG